MWTPLTWSTLVSSHLGLEKKISGADFHVGARFAPDDLCTASREERCTCGGATWIISIVTEPKPGATRNCWGLCIPELCVSSSEYRCCLALSQGIPGGRGGVFLAWSDATWRNPIWRSANEITKHFEKIGFRRWFCWQLGSRYLTKQSAKLDSSRWVWSELGSC